MRADEFPPDLGEPRTQALGHSLWITDPHASGDGRQVHMSLTEHYRHVAPGVNPASAWFLDIELSEPGTPTRRFSIEVDSHDLVDLAALGLHGVQHIRDEAARDWPWPTEADRRRAIDEERERRRNLTCDRCREQASIGPCSEHA